MFDRIRRLFSRQSQASDNRPDEIRVTASVPACPYCGAVLDAMPTRKKRCPECTQDIQVKRPFGAPAEVRVLMTTEQAAANAAQWDAASQRTEWQRHLASVGIDEQAFEREAARLGASVSAADVARNLLTAAMSAGGDLHRLKMIASLMARLARQQGRDPLMYLQTVQRLDLEKMRDNARAVTVSPPSGRAREGCQCDSWTGREFTVDEALAEMPLPCGPDCVCAYRPIFKWE